MENLVPLGTGNSRFMKSNISPDTSLAQLIQMLNNGTFPYDVGSINPAGISQQGTPLNKATLLQDATAALYGLGSDAVPDDVLAFIGAKSVMFTDGERKALSDYSVGDRVFMNVSGARVPFVVGPKNYEGSGAVALVLDQVSQQTAWDSGGSTTFDGSTLDSKCQEFINSLSEDAQSALVTCAVKTSASANSPTVNTIQRKCTVPSLTELSYTSGQYWQSFNTEGTSFGLSDLRTVSDENGENQRTWTRSVPNDVAGQAFYLRPEEQITQGAPTSSQYFRPMIFMSADYSGEFFDYLIPPTLSLASGEQITIPSNQLDQSTKIATGSYVGTGTYGDSNPNSLTFEFEPKLVIVNYSGFAIFVRGSTKTLVAVSESNYPFKENEVSWGVNKVSWYHTGNSERQLNKSGITYFYVAIS